MSRRCRDHEPGAFYLVAQYDQRKRLFLRESDYRIFECVLQSSLRLYDCRVHAFCWEAHAARFLVQIGEAPLARLMQRLNSLYARRVHRGRLFQLRYYATLIDPDADLVEFVRLLHDSSMMKETFDRDDYPCSSHDVYLGTRAAAWVTTSSTLRRLRDRGVSYEAWMNCSLEPPETLPRRDLNEVSGADSTAISLGQIVQSVSSMLEVPSDLICSPTRSRKLTLARAIVAWHARKRGVASYTEIAHRCHRHPSSISAAVERYRHAQPILFELDTLRSVPSYPPRKAGGSGVEKLTLQ